MGHVKEPVGINFVVDPVPLTSIEKQQISNAIAYFKATGKRTSLPKTENSKKAVKKSNTAA